MDDTSSDDDDFQIPPAPVAPSPRGRRPRAYASPERYQHMRPLPDIIAPDLDVLFCGINPGMKSSKTGTHFAHPTNKFWRSLHYSGLTSRLVPSVDGHLLPTEFNYGLTVLVDRPTAEQSELSTLEMRLNALPFTVKLLRLKPKVVCFVGKKIWDVYESVIKKTATLATSDSGTSEITRGDVDATGGAGGSSTNGTNGGVKREPEALPTPPITPIKTEPNLRSPASTTQAGPGNQGGKRKKEEKSPFDWTRPRLFRLPHVQGGQPTRYTYFWVVPNTSGLERTPLAEQIILFGHLKTFKDEIKAGQVPPMAYKEFDLEGVRATVEAMRIAAEAKDRSSRTAA